MSAIVAPLSSMLSASALVTGYFDDLETLDKLSKKTSMSLEERATKQQLLGRYTKADLASYRKMQKALVGFREALGAVAGSIMSAVLPALTWTAKKLSKFFKLVREHYKFVLAFFSGMAVVISAAMVPALTQMAAAAWAAMAPFLPFIAIVLGLALLIDDLWTYIGGGVTLLYPNSGLF